jgi:hypothetical protein
MVGLIESKKIYIVRRYTMAKNKPVFQSNNSKAANGQVSKSENKTTAPAPKKSIRGNSRGK